MGRKKRGRFRAVIVLPIFVVFCFLVMEGLCRLLQLPQRLREGYYVNIWLVDNDLQKIVNKEDAHMMWAPRPRYRNMDGSVRISAAGFRDKEYRLEKEPGLFRILSLGDSSTFGTKLNLEETYHAQLEERLNRERGAAGIRYEVINGGTTGYTSRQGLALYQVKGHHYAPDIVTAYFGTNDQLARYFLSDKEILDRSGPVWVREVKRSVLHRLALYKTLRGLLFYQRERRQRAAVPRVAIEDYRQNLLDLDAACRENGAQLVLISPAFCSRGEDLRIKGPSIHRYRLVLHELARSHNIPLVELPEMAEDIEGACDGALFQGGDYDHPSRMGHTRLMEALHACLVDHNLLP